MVKSIAIRSHPRCDWISRIKRKRFLENKCTSFSTRNGNSWSVWTKGKTIARRIVATQLSCSKSIEIWNGILEARSSFDCVQNTKNEQKNHRSKIRLNNSMRVCVAYKTFMLRYFGSWMSVRLSLVPSILSSFRLRITKLPIVAVIVAKHRMENVCLPQLVARSQNINIIQVGVVLSSAHSARKIYWIIW